MSEAEHPARVEPDHEVTIEELRQLMGASTPHFALQIRNRIRKLTGALPPAHPARIEGEREIARLEQLAVAGETRGEGGDHGEPVLPSVDPAASG